MLWDRNHHDLSRKLLRRSTRGDTKVTFPTFPQKLSLQQLKLHISWVHPLQSWDHFSTKSPSLPTPFSTFARETGCHQCQTLCWSAAALHPASRSPQNGVIRLHSSGGQKIWQSEGATPETVGKMRKKESSCLPCSQTGVRSGIVMQEDLIHPPI